MLKEDLGNTLVWGFLTPTVMEVTVEGGQSECDAVDEIPREDSHWTPPLLIPFFRTGNKQAWAGHS